MRFQLALFTHRFARCRCLFSAPFAPKSIPIRSFHVTDTPRVRARYPDERPGKSAEEEPKNEEKEEQNDGPKKIDPAVIRKLRMYVLAVAGLSFVSSFILMSQMFTGDRNLADGLTNEDFTRPGIPMKTFIEKYLNHGEVKRIVFAPSNTRAIAILHPGAIIDGEAAKTQSIVVDYPQNAQQFWADIRKAEAELGIGLAQGVQIDLYQGMTTLKVVELLIGVVILAWLGTQYGRLLRKRLLENQAKKSGGASKK